MKIPGKQKLWMAVSFLISPIVLVYIIEPLYGGEFGGGRLGGPLVKMAYKGSELFLVALVATFFFPRVAAIIALLSSILCVPLYLYFLFPAQFHHIFGQGLNS